MKAIVPVAGYGTRLKPHTDRIQKALLPVAGRATLDFIVDPLLSIGVDNITLIIGHFGDQVRNHVKNIEGNFNFVVQEQRLGLGHAVYQGLEDIDSPLLIHLGDTIFELDFMDFASGSSSKIAVGRVEDPRRFGVVDVDDQDMIRGFFEKHPDPPSNLAISGLYYIAKERELKAALETLFDKSIKTKDEYQLTDALEIMLRTGSPFKAYELDRWHDVGVPETCIETNRSLLNSNHGEFPGIEIIEPVHIGNGCTIKESRIGPYVTIMDNCSIHGCAIENSIILENSNLNNKNYTGRIVGKDGSDLC